MADIDLKTATPDTTLPTTGFLFGADSQAAASPSVFPVQSVATTLLGSTTLTGATVTTSSPVIDAAQTWNDGGANVTFTGLRFNATDTASASASLLMDLQVGGASRFNVRKDGVLFTPSQIVFSSGGGRISRQINFGGIVFDPANHITLGVGASAYTLIGSTLGLHIGSTDTILTRRAAANLRLGAADAAAPVAQTLSVQSVVAGTTNTAGENLTITGSQGTGTGAGGSIIFQVAPAGSSGTAQNALADALTIDSTRFVTFVGGFGYSGASFDLVGSGATSTLRAYVGTGVQFAANFSASGIVTGSGMAIGWSSGNNNLANPTPDVALARDAANTLALRNGTNAQAFRVYKTFTDASNNSGLEINIGAANANFAIIQTFAIGTGTLTGGLSFKAPAGSIILNTGNIDRWSVNSSGHLVAGADNSYDIGTNATTARPRSIFVGTSLTLGDGANIVAQTTTGTKIGTATTQKLGFFNATPVAQPTAVADATDAATVITQLNALLTRMRNLGLIAT